MKIFTTKSPYWKKKMFKSNDKCFYIKKVFKRAIYPIVNARKEIIMIKAVIERIEGKKFFK